MLDSSVQLAARLYLDTIHEAPKIGLEKYLEALITLNNVLLESLKNSIEKTIDLANRFPDVANREVVSSWGEVYEHITALTP